MKFRKMVSALVVASMAAMSLAGCSDAASSSTAAASTADDTAEGAASEAAVTVDGDGPTFKIGAIGPLTGAGANYGTAVVNAAELAVKEINENGGINGYQVEYRGEDDELDNEKSVNAYNTLKDWGMQILLGSTTSGCTIAVTEKSQADGIFQLTPSGTAADCTKYDNVFRVCFSDPAQGTKSAQYIGENDLAKTIGIIYDSSDVYSSGIEQAFAAEAENQGLDIQVAEAFTADSNTDFTAQLQKCKDAGVDLIFLPIYYTQAATILTQASTMGIESDFFGCDGLDGMLDMENFDASLAEGVMLLTPFAADATDDLTVNFVSNYKEAYGGVTPNQFGADAYDGVYALKAALEEMDATPEMSNEELCEALKEGMTKVTVEGLTGNITWTADGEPDKEPKAVVIKNAAYVSMENDTEDASSTAA